MSEIATNRKAPRDYHILEKYEAGVELRGTEVKSIRLGKLNISDAFARVDRGQVWLYGCDIQTYEKASHTTHEPRRTRRLLLHKNEIMKLLATGLENAPRTRRVESILGHLKSVDLALASAQAGDLLMIQADTADETVQYLKEKYGAK